MCVWGGGRKNATSVASQLYLHVYNSQQQLTTATAHLQTIVDVDAPILIKVNTSSLQPKPASHDNNNNSSSNNNNNSV